MTSSKVLLPTLQLVSLCQNRSSRGVQTGVILVSSIGGMGVYVVARWCTTAVLFPGGGMDKAADAGAGTGDFKFVRIPSVLLKHFLQSW